MHTLHSIICKTFPISIMKQFYFLSLAFLFLIACKEEQVAVSSPSNVAEKKNIVSEKELNFVWSDVVYDAELQDSMTRLMINEAFLDTISEEEKAAIGFVATFVGNECDWDGAYKEDRSNLVCTVLDALDLGYQCSDTHLGFLREWFDSDTASLNVLSSDSCPTLPGGSTNFSEIESMHLFVKNNIITITSVINYGDVRQDVYKTKRERVYFNVSEEGLRVGERFSED